MTDKMKMPEVGKRYKLSALPGHTITIYDVDIENAQVFYHFGEHKSIRADGSVGVLYAEDFWDCFEEIEKMPTVKENLTDDKAQIALKELKKDLSRGIIYTNDIVAAMMYYGELEEKAQNLINALDDSNIPQKADCGIVEDTKEKIKFYTNPAHGIVDDFEEKPKSIWEDLAITAFHRYGRQGIEIEGPDFFKLIGSLEQRIKKLEENNAKLHKTIRTSKKSFNRKSPR